MNMHAVFLMLTVFLAATVEVVEMATIVLGVGMTRGWVSTFLGGGVGLLVLAGIVGGLGPLLISIPIAVLRMIVGMLLLLFGLQWLRKSVIRISQRGFLSGNDEEEATTERESGPLRHRIDWTAFALSFKGVFLEGLEIAFIVVTFGAATDRILLAVYAALAAMVIVAGLSALARRGLKRVPGHVLKYIVGLLLTTYGTFWAVEGADLAWPGGDLAILGLLALYAVASLAAVWFLHRTPLASSPGNA